MIFYLSGPDTYRALEKLRELKEKFVREVDPSGLGLVTIDGSTLGVNDLGHVFDTAPLFARRRCIVVRTLSKNKDKDVPANVIERLAHHPDDGNLIIFFEDDEPPAKSTLHVWLVKHAYHQRFPRLEGRELVRWVSEEWKKRNRTIEPDALTRLIERTEGDAWILSRTIARLDASLEPDAVITQSIVEANVHDDTEAEIFPLIDALLHGDAGRAAPMLQSFFAQGENPQAFVSLLETQLRTLLLLSENPRASIPGVHPYVVKKLSPLARRYSFAELREMYETLSRIDQALKSSTTDPVTLFLSFLLQMPQKIV